LNELDKLMDEFIKSDEGINELEKLLSETEIDKESLSKIEQKVFSKINMKKKKKTNFKSKLFIYSAAAVFLLSTITLQNQSFRAWASNNLSYLPMFNVPFENKSTSPSYEFDSFIGDHKNLKINNLAFNNELPYFQIEFEYDTKINVDQFGGFDKFGKYWENIPIYLKVNNKKYELESKGNGLDSTGLIDEELFLKNHSTKMALPSNNQIQLQIGKKSFLIKLKEINKVYYPSRSNHVKNIELKTMVSNEKGSLLVNYIQENDIMPFSSKPFSPYIIDSKGNKSYLKSNESGSMVRNKFKAKLNKLDTKSLTLITPSIQNFISYNDLYWTIPIPKTKDEKIKLPPLILPNANIKIDGFIVRWSEYENEENTIEIITPKRDNNQEKWLSELYLEHIDPKLLITNQIVTSREYNSGDRAKKAYIPPVYGINIKGMDQHVIKLKITLANIIENGPWKTDLSNIK